MGVNSERARRNYRTFEVLSALRFASDFPLRQCFLYNALSDKNMKTLPVILLGVGAAALGVRTAAPQDRSPATPAAAARLDTQPDSYPQSELRGMIEEYRADRGNMRRFYDIPFAATRRNRMKDFYAGWLAR